MTRYITRRLILLIPTLLGLILLTFGIFKLTPGDPAAIMLGQSASPEQIAIFRERLGLDEPVFIQFAKYTWTVLQGDLGYSIQGNVPVIKAVMDRLPYTLELAGAAMTVAVLLGVTTGIVSATTRYKWIDNLIMILTVGSLSVPEYWLATLLILVFGIQLGWIPVLGDTGLKHLILPTIALALGPAAVLTRLTRSTMLEALSSNYVWTAHSKGLREKLVVLKHVLPNALIPVVTVIGLMFASMLGGAVFVEAAFNRPGLGTFAVKAITNRDYPQIQGVVIIAALTFVLINLAVDISYAYLDPRIRYE